MWLRLWLRLLLAPEHEHPRVGRVRHGAARRDVKACQQLLPQPVHEGIAPPQPLRVPRPGPGHPLPKVLITTGGTPIISSCSAVGLWHATPACAPPHTTACHTPPPLHAHHGVGPGDFVWQRPVLEHLRPGRLSRVHKGGLPSWAHCSSPRARARAHTHRPPIHQLVTETHRFWTEQRAQFVVRAHPEGHAWRRHPVFLVAARPSVPTAHPPRHPSPSARSR
jgi:hypothetical protein